MNDKATRVCFATFEIKGINPGGVGVLIHNLLKTYAGSSHTEAAVLWYGDEPCLEPAFKAMFPGVAFYDVDTWADRDEDDDRVWPTRQSAINHRHWKAIRTMRALRAIEKEHGGFDVVEFPDFAGVALPAIQEKRLGSRLKDTTISVRIHSTESILRTVDHRPGSRDNARTHDLERKALQEADLVIAHLGPVADSLANHFGFPDEWRRQVRIEAPPVLIDREPATDTVEVGPETPILFTSKLQWFKRPHVFINGVSRFLTETPGYKGDIYLLAHEVDDELTGHCRSLVPQEFSGRFHFDKQCSASVRESLISQGVAVFPTAYESFCLAAYEASLLGAAVIVNQQNPAFSAGTGWSDGVNCRTTGATAADLADTLADMFKRGSAGLTPMALEVPSEPYWVGAGATATAEPDQPTDAAGLSAIIAVVDPKQSWLDTVLSVIAAVDGPTEIIVVHGKGTGPAGAAEVQALGPDTSLRFHDIGYRAETAALLNAGLRLATRDLVLVADAGSVFDPGFVTAGLEYLSRTDRHDFVVPQSGRAEDTVAGPVLAFMGTARIGNALRSAPFINLLGIFEAIGRREAYLDLGYDEELDRYGDWDFFLRATQRGYSVLADNAVGVYIGEVNALIPPFRAHLDTVLAKQPLSGLNGNLAMVIDAFPEQKPLRPRRRTRKEGPDLMLAGQPLSYYRRQKLPWWRIALRHPTKPLRWLAARDLSKRSRD